MSNFRMSWPAESMSKVLMHDGSVQQFKCLKVHLNSCIMAWLEQTFSRISYDKYCLQDNVYPTEFLPLLA